MATQTTPANALPKMAGIQFLTIIWLTVTGAPANMPAGSKNMLATECSILMATNAEIGNQMPTILPPRSRAASDKNTAMHTIQLHMMALTNAWPNGRLVFVSAICVASFWAPPPRRPAYLAAKAKATQPAMLPNRETIQFLYKSDIVALPSMTAIGTTAALPVKSWPPLLRMSNRLTGKSAAKIIFWRPGDDSAMSPMLPEMESESRPAKPT
mmetsp:Transcript_79020/g.201118  ORF Transcript_79020/g.201118 Transcript_79020/m.201118 type:complete len:212 (-) Transcript_79020:408-1043(-)